MAGGPATQRPDAPQGEPAADAEVARLAARIALARRFGLYIIVCETHQVANAALVQLSVMVEAHGRLARWVRLDPYAPEGDGDPLTAGRLVQRVFDPLLALAPSAAESLAAIVDATRSPPLDDGAWTTLFRHMNLTRDLLANRLQGPLLLAILPRMEAPFAHAAPDLWSIRSSVSVFMAPRPMAGAEAPRLALEMAALLDDPQAEARTFNISELLAPKETGTDGDGLHDVASGAASAALATARRMVERDPRDVVAVRGLCRELARAARGARDKDGAAHALPLAAECVGVARRLATLSPGLEGALTLAVATATLADLHHREGAHDAALAGYREAASLLREALDGLTEPGVGLLYNLSVYLNRAGDLLRARGDDAGAFVCFEEALGLRRALYAREPRSGPWARGLVRSVNRVGDALQRRGSRPEALALYDESLALTRAAARREPRRVERLHDLLNDLLKVGSARTAERDLPGARAAVTEVREVAAAIVALAPYLESSRYALALARMAAATVAEAEGDAAGAAGAWREAATELGVLTQNDPTNERWRRAAGICREALERSGRG